MHQPTPELVPSQDFAEDGHSVTTGNMALPVTANAWTQLVYRRQVANGQALRVATANMQQQEKKYGAYGSWGNNDLVLGHDIDNPFYDAFAYGGDVALVLVYNASLSTAQLSAVHQTWATRLGMATPPSIPTDGAYGRTIDRPIACRKLAVLPL